MSSVLLPGLSARQNNVQSLLFFAPLIRGLIRTETRGVLLLIAT